MLPAQSGKGKVKDRGPGIACDYLFVRLREQLQGGISRASVCPIGTTASRSISDGSNYWHSFADQPDENLWVEGVLPSILHEDSRYYTLGHSGFVNRRFYAVIRVLATRTDSGGETVNATEIFGARAPAAISSAYYPLT